MAQKWRPKTLAKKDTQRARIVLEQFSAYGKDRLEKNWSLNFIPKRDQGINTNQWGNFQMNWKTRDNAKKCDEGECSPF